jgi:hypothetical protein
MKFTSKLRVLGRSALFSFSMSTNKLLYFGYGSNLLSERIHIQNPSAVFKTIGRLDVSVIISSLLKTFEF